MAYITRNGTMVRQPIPATAYDYNTDAGYVMAFGEAQTLARDIARLTSRPAQTSGFEIAELREMATRLHKLTIEMDRAVNAD